MPLRVRVKINNECLKCYHVTTYKCSFPEIKILTSQRGHNSFQIKYIQLLFIQIYIKQNVHSSAFVVHVSTLSNNDGFNMFNQHILEVRIHSFDF